MLVNSRSSFRNKEVQKQKQVDGAKVLNISTPGPEYVITFKSGYLMGNTLFTHRVKLDPDNCYNL